MRSIKIIKYPAVVIAAAFSICLLPFSNTGLAEDLALSEQQYLQDFPVVLSASRLSQPLGEAPNAMTVIDREMIKASGFRTIPDLFRLVPGMYVSYNSGSEPFVAYHGTTDNLSRRMQVLVDGRSVFMPPIGSVFWESLPVHIDDIERIEVVRGPAAASHGSNSTQGVLNIITREPGASPGFRASVTEGTGGISDAVIHIDRAGETLDYRISAGYRSDYGYDSHHLVENNALTYVENNDSHYTKLLNLRSNYRPNAIDSFDIQIGLTEGKVSTGKTGEANAPHDKISNEHFQQITWLHDLEGGDELKLKFYHIYQHELNYIPPISPYTALNDSYTNTRDDLELQHTLQTSSSNRLVWGGSMRYDTTKAPARFLQEQTVYQTTVFAHDEWRITPQWLLNTGAMQESSGLGHKHLSPRAALIYKVADKQSIRAGISQAYRNPSVYEERGYYYFDDPAIKSVYPNGLYRASGGLRSESMLSREVGYLGEFPEHGFSVDARIYHDELSDIIYETEDVTTGVEDPKDFVNAFSAEQNGLEITTKHYWGNRNQLTFNYSYMVLSSKNNLSYTSQYSESMPRNMISALYSKKFADDIALSLGYYQQDAMLPIDRGVNDRQSFTTRWDARIAKEFMPSNGSAGGEFALVVQGLFNEHYIDYLKENKFNQRIFMTATLRY